MKKGWRQVGACLPAELIEAIENGGGDGPQGNSPSPMRNSQGGGSARAMETEKAPEAVKPPASQQGGRPLTPNSSNVRCLPADSRRKANGRHVRAAGRHLRLVWVNPHASALSGTRRV